MKEGNAMPIDMLKYPFNSGENAMLIFSVMRRSLLSSHFDIILLGPLTTTEDSAFKCSEDVKSYWLLDVSVMKTVFPKMKLLGAVDTRRYPRVENRAWSDQENHEDRGSKDRAASTCGHHNDSFNNASRRGHWQNVVFTDESQFVLGTDDNRVRVWRRPGQCYVDDILRPHVGPFLNGLPGKIFQQDNARPHTARVDQGFLRHFQTLPWPARSLDLSPVEPVWDQLKWQMPSCHSVHDLEMAVQDLWAHLP
ncbi:transposable element Tcb2 transposase [Trichonephila clavipes]|nr:transposable element Tcb2 transposase [Trichonephila clavipes]